MELVSLIISLISGAIGGNIGGALTPRNLGVLANTLIGLFSGATGDYLLRGLTSLGGAAAAAPAAGAGGLDIGSLLSTIGVSGVTGGIITAIISSIVHASEKTPPSSKP